MIRKLKFRYCLYALILMTAIGMVPTGPQSGSLAAPQDQQQAQKDEQQKKKKKGGLFGGMKAVSGESSEQQEATATAGSKSVGEGEKIGSVTPASADRQQVSAMENYSVPQNDLKKFQEDGRLKPKQ